MASFTRESLTSMYEMIYLHMRYGVQCLYTVTRDRERERIEKERERERENFATFVLIRSYIHLCIFHHSFYFKCFIQLMLSGVIYFLIYILPIFAIEDSVCLLPITIISPTDHFAFAINRPIYEEESWIPLRDV